MSTNGGNQAIPTPAVQNVNQNAPTPPMQNNVTAQNIPLLSTQNSSNNQTTQIFPPLPTLPQSNTQQAADRNRYTAAYNSDAGASQRSSRSSTHRRAEARRHRRPPSTDDETGEYAYNQQRPETNSCREIKIEHFSSDNKELDFAIWVNQYEEAVNRSLNPHSRRRHYICCLKWLPSVLKADAYSIWSRSEYKNSNWDLLKTELETAFEDGSVRAEWKTNLKAYMWDEHSQSLQSYCAKVKRLVDNFEKEMANCPAAKRAQYHLRFVNGLPDDYIEHVKLSLPPTCLDVDKAREVCMQFQSCKRARIKNADVGATVTSQDSITTARITQQETELARLKEQIKQLSAANKPRDAKDDDDMDETLALYWEKKQMEDEADLSNSAWPKTGVFQKTENRRGVFRAHPRPFPQPIQETYS